MAKITASALESALASTSKSNFIANDVNWDNIIKDMDDWTISQNDDRPHQELNLINDPEDIDSDDDINLTDDDDDDDDLDNAIMDADLETGGDGTEDESSADEGEDLPLAQEVQVVDLTAPEAASADQDESADQTNQEDPSSVFIHLNRAIMRDQGQFPITFLPWERAEKHCEFNPTTRPITTSRKSIPSGCSSTSP
ncbi:unnamed protein product [Sphagnum tenellum]